MITISYVRFFVVIVTLHYTVECIVDKCRLPTCGIRPKNALMLCENFFARFSPKFGPKPYPNLGEDLFYLNSAHNESKMESSWPPFAG